MPTITLEKLEKFTQGKSINEMEIGKQLLAETAAYAESSMCRRRHLLHYFGENYDKDNCENCDNCLNPKKQVEAKDLLCAVIETIIATKEKLDENDRVYFGIMAPNKSFDEAILKKEFTVADVTPDGYINVKLLPEDTINLESGVYYYSVKALYMLGDNDVRISTLVDKTKFIIND